MSIIDNAILGMSRPAGLRQDEFEQLRDIIYREAGIFFPDNKVYLLESRLTRRLTILGLRSYAQYIQAIKTTAKEEIARLVEAVTVNETFFFRNVPQLDMLENHLLPSIISARLKQGVNRINIWSAACSSGEEPYTVALLIRERIQPRFPAVKFRVVGTDINTQVLSAAQEGIYREYAIRQVPKTYMDKYFTPSDDRFVLRPEIREMVEYRQLNLYDRGAMRGMRMFDVIFCANVLIYFDQESKRQVVSLLYDSLNRNGALFLGFSESLHGLSQAFRPVHYDRTIAYIKD